MSDDSDMAQTFLALRETRRSLRAEHGVPCPKCRKERPRAHPSILLPGQRCKVDGYRDPRQRLPRITDGGRHG